MKPGQQIERLCVWVTPHIFQIKYLANMSSKGELWKLDRGQQLCWCDPGLWGWSVDGRSQVYLVWLGRYLLINYLSNTITNSNNDININKHRYRIFIDFWGRGWSETVRSVQIKDGRCHGVYLETYSNEFLDGEALILGWEMACRWLPKYFGNKNYETWNITYAEEDDSVSFLFDKYKITFDFPSIQLPKVSISVSLRARC